MGASDHRDDLTWVVVELTQLGERSAEEGHLEIALRNTLGVDGSHPIFVPYITLIRNGRRSILSVVEGYVFVASGLPDTSYFGLPTGSPYVSSILHRVGRSGLPVLTTVPDASVRSLRDNLAKMISREIEDGTHVRVVEGLFVGLTGRVVGLDGDNAYVLIDLRSLKAVKAFPRFYLRPVDGILGFEHPSDVFPSYSKNEDEEVE